MLPPYLTRRKGVFNVPAPDQLSFHYALAAAMHDGNRRRGQLQYLDIILLKNWVQIEYPIQINDLIRLTNGTLNSKSTPLVFNLYTIDDDGGMKKRCIYFGNEDDKACISILYHEGRFYFITNFARFMSGKMAHRGRCFYCQRCLLRFSCDSKRKAHQRFCDYITIYSSFPIDAKTIRDQDFLQLPKETSTFNINTTPSVFDFIEKRHVRLYREEENRAMRLATKPEPAKCSAKQAIRLSKGSKVMASSSAASSSAATAYWTNRMKLEMTGFSMEHKEEHQYEVSVGRDQAKMSIDDADED